ncbi:MAG: hypothetical protein ABW044_12295 [Cellvibrio sp.]
MTRHSNDYNDILTAYKPRPWGEALSSDTQNYSRPDPSSKTNIPSRDSSFRSGTGSNIIPWS